MFRFYQDVIALRLASATLRDENIEVVHTNDEQRVIAFRRWDDDREFLVVGSLNNQAFDQPRYEIKHPTLDNGTWAERLSSDADAYGGAGVGNSVPLRATAGALEVVVPANCVVVLERVLPMA
jgi:1,4-alpha-glucan branching enzyme